MLDIKIAPSILAADFAQLGEQVRQAEAGGGKLIHVDVMDGRFVPNITMGPLVVSALRPITALPLDVHLMIVEPAGHVDAFIDAGADRVTVHLEADANLHRTLTHIQERGAGAGVAVNPHTPASALETIIDYLDVVIVMTVNPGFGGQSFIQGMMPKVAAIRDMARTRGREIDIEVDGGIKPETAPESVRSGANVLVAGSSVFSYPDGVAAGVESIQQAIKGVPLRGSGAQMV